MAPRRASRARRRCAGTATVEFAFALPLLLMLTLPVVDFGRAIHAKLILIDISREGASLASRSSLAAQPVMDALAATSPPLDMSGNGMIYMTKIMGREEHGALRNVVLEQHRWVQGWRASAYAPASQVWNCGSGGTRWTDAGTCADIPADGASPTTATMTGGLRDGQIAWVVESFYRLDTLFAGLDFGFGRVPTPGPDLRAAAIF